MRKSRRKIIQIFLITSILLIFCVLGIIVSSLSKNVSEQMSESAVANLQGRLDLVSSVFETVLHQEADFQKMLAQELASLDDAEGFLKSYSLNRTMVKVSLVPAGERQGVSHTGEAFSTEDLDFSGGKTVDGLLVSKAYVNGLGTWAYTMRCPVTAGGLEIAALYVEYIFDSFEETLPSSFYGNAASLHVMDMESLRFVLEPRGVGERVWAGHVDLEDFIQANHITSEDIRSEISESTAKGNRVLFYHEVKGRNCLVYMWPVNSGSLYLVGYVPVEAIQKEGDAVKQNILTVEIVTIVAFFLCCAMYFLNYLQQERAWKERAAEREEYGRQLSEALRAAHAANEAKSKFLSSVSHDIRTPMNAIIGFLTLMRDEADNPDTVLEYNRRIDAASQHLLGLINDVLDMNKIESGSTTLSISEMNLADVIDGINTIIRPQTNAKGQNFEILVKRIDFEHLLGDKMRLNQILINLLSNAVKYTPEKGTIRFEVEELPQVVSSHSRVRFTVSDNGIGMSEAYQKVLFEPFSREEDNQAVHEIQGTGLGMPITKNLVELMGGTIAVESKLGRGSTFTVEIEFQIQERAVDPTFWTDHKLARMIVVDDDEEFCRHIVKTMSNVGVATDYAADGHTAVQMMRQHREAGEPYDMILLDWKMPTLDGIETARLIRENYPDKIPILLLTAYDWSDIEREAKEIGVDYFLPKPFFMTTFKEAVKRVMGSRQSTPEESNSDVVRGKHILVVDDIEVNRIILIKILSSLGAVCDSANNGQEAVDKFEASQPGDYDLIMMDVQMPVMDGYAATRTIRGSDHPSAGSVPIIAMTANAFVDDVREAIESGMNAHIAKPVQINNLKATIQRVLDKEEQQNIMQ